MPAPRRPSEPAAPRRVRPRTWALVAVGLALAAGCGSRGPVDAGPLASPTPRAPRESVAPCRFDAPETWGTLPHAPPALALASSGGARMVVAREDASTLAVRAARGIDAPIEASVPMPGADSIVGLEALDDDRFVVFTRGPCPPSLDAPRCLFARALDAAGRAPSEAVPVPLDGELRSVRILASGTSVWVARAQHGAGAALDRFDLGATSGLSHTLVALADPVLAPDEATEILGLAVSGGAWAWLHRHGGSEDANGAVVLGTIAGAHPVEALHEALVLESFQWRSGSLLAIAAMEFSRPTLLQLGADGRVRGAPAELAPGASLPGPLARRRRASIVGQRGDAAVAVRDAMGDAVGAPLRLDAPDLRAADVARHGEDFLVATARGPGEGAVSLALVGLRCGGPVRSR